MNRIEEYRQEREDAREYAGDSEPKRKSTQSTQPPQAPATADYDAPATSQNADAMFPLKPMAPSIWDRERPCETAPIPQLWITQMGSRLYFSAGSPEDAASQKLHAGTDPTDTDSLPVVCIDVTHLFPNYGNAVYLADQLDRLLTHLRIPHHMHNKTSKENTQVQGE